MDWREVRCSILGVESRKGKEGRIMREGEGERGKGKGGRGKGEGKGGGGKREGRGGKKKGGRGKGKGERGKGKGERGKGKGERGKGKGGREKVKSEGKRYFDVLYGSRPWVLKFMLPTADLILTSHKGRCLLLL